MTDHAARLDAMRDAAPLVQNITNFVAMNTMANVMLACGASPAMVHAPEEVVDFARRAAALTINIGTLDADRLPAMRAAATAMEAQGKPWVFDPVAVGATTFRRRAAAGLLARSPTVIRGNASEIMALAGKSGLGRGVDAADEVEAAAPAARALALRCGCIVAVTGPEDLVTDGARTLRIGNGHPLMPRVTALGCALNGVVAAFLATGDDPLETTATALAFYGLSGENAARRAQGPGSFAVAFLDALAAMDGPTLKSGAKVRSE